MDLGHCVLLLTIIGHVNCLEPQLKKYWNGQAQNQLMKVLATKPNTKIAKNVILFLGDGMGVSTITAARILKGQNAGKSGEETELSFEKFPYTALSKTYNTDAQIADSAGTATAFLCGVKTKAGVVGVDDRVTRNDCATETGASVDSIVHWSHKEGKANGLVTTSRITHATPAAAYAHSANRDWEDDFKMKSRHPAAEGVCVDIARQLVENNSHIQVLLGGGRSHFLPNTTADPEYPTKKGNRRDGKNLIQQWMNTKPASTYSYVWNKTAFNDVIPQKTDYLLGLFEPSHMQYAENINNDGAGEPTLSEMTEKAINVLRKNNKGFFLLVEGGRIDHGHHDGIAKYALTDTLAFDDAISTAVNMTSEEDTLIVVTADHSHVFMLGGYTSRGQSIFGLANSPTDQPTDNIPYTTITYGNGPGYAVVNGSRENITGINLESITYKQQSAVPLRSETHGGEDVSVYSQGPMAHLLNSVHEQNYIAHVMAYASCVGLNKGHCNSEPQTTTPKANAGSSTLSSVGVLFVGFVFSISDICFN